MSPLRGIACSSILAVALCLVIGAPARADQGAIVLSFAPGQQVAVPPQGVIAPGDTFSFYVLGEFPADVAAWEAGVVVPADVQVQSATLAQAGTFNLGDATQNEWVVGFEGCLEPPAGLFPLATYQATLLADNGPVEISLTASPLASAGPGQTAWATCDPTAPTQAGCTTIGGGITVNPDLSSAPSPPAAVARLLPAIPNPFNPRVELRFELPAAGTARLRIHDAAGRLVREFALKARAAGRHRIEWDGTDAEGHRLASGAYLVQLQTDHGSDSQRITLLK